MRKCREEGTIYQDIFPSPANPSSHPHSTISRPPHILFPPCTILYSLSFSLSFSCHSFTDLLSIFSGSFETLGSAAHSTNPNPKRSTCELMLAIVSMVHIQSPRCLGVVSGRAKLQSREASGDTAPLTMQFWINMLKK